MAAHRPTASTAGSGSGATGIMAPAVVAKNFIFFAGRSCPSGRTADDKSDWYGQAVDPT